MKLTFDIKHVPNFAITDKGKFALWELDHEDFLEYCENYNTALIENRIKQQCMHKEDVISEAHE